jgi:hypothetical protein
LAPKIGGEQFRVHLAARQKLGQTSYRREPEKVNHSDLAVKRLVQPSLHIDDCHGIAANLEEVIAEPDV